MSEPAFAKELVDRNRTPVIRIVVIHEDESIICDLIIQVIEAAPYAGMPVCIDSENRNWSDTNPLFRQRLIEPPFYKFKIRGQSEIGSALLHLVKGHPAVVAI